MKGLGAIFSSQTDNWKTPEKFYKKLNKEFHFNFDPCPINPKFDGLKIEWGKRSFVNPPYSQISKPVTNWVKKGYEESLKGKLVVFLLPSRTDVKWFHDYCLKYAEEIRFIKGRLKFEGAKNSAPFPSMIVIFKGELA